jgi:DNA-binding NarL/FixJ family response regulator
MATGAHVGTRLARVMIADDHQLLRWTLGELISADPELELVASCSSGESAVAGVAEHRPDLVVMDLQMPGMGGIEATRRITRDHPRTRVVILTGHVGLVRQAAALAAGAVCVLTKDIAPTELVDRIRQYAVAPGPRPA